MENQNDNNKQENNFDELFSNLQDKLGGLMNKFGVDQSMLDNFMDKMNLQNFDPQSIFNQQNNSQNAEIEQLTKNASKGDAESQYLLGRHFYTGDSVEEDNEIAADYFAQAAENGNVKAQIALARCYELGIGVEKDLTEASKWYSKAADLGDAEGQARFASYCYNDSDFEKAFALYSKSSEQGNYKGMSGLARCYFEGNGTDKDEVKAFQLFTTAAEAGDIDAQRGLADCYGTGCGTERDSDKAAYWLDKADETEAADPELKLENSKLHDLDDDDEDYTETQEDSQDKGNPLGGLFDMVGNLFGGGADSGKNFLLQAIKTAAEHGETDAQIQLGDIYFNGSDSRLGITVEKDIETARYWYTKASEAGDPIAVQRLENFK